MKPSEFFKKLDKITTVKKRDWRWKGENVKYGAKHGYINNHKEKTGICVICNEYKKTEWSNIDHKYRRDFADYMELCRKCHGLYHKCIKVHNKGLLEKEIKRSITRFVYRQIYKGSFIK